MKALVVGLGIGQLYKTVLTNLGYEVITVDSNIAKGADLPTVDSAVIAHAPFDITFVCTPNHTHFELAAKVAPYSKIVFIEKPGVSNSFSWTNLVTVFKKTRFMMVKNNMWRSNIAELQSLASQSDTVKIQWLRHNCIPNPGSWFTTKRLAFGGVSRDLMPHLLSIYIALNPNWRKVSATNRNAVTNWKLADIESTEYGTVNYSGTYDVDDRCTINFGDKWALVADWRTLEEDNSSIDFIANTNTNVELGWCPEDAYTAMIKDAVANINNHQFWLDQFEIDTWIHEQIENL